MSRDFTILWLGQAVSQLGSRGYGLAIMLWVLAATGSPATVGLVSTVTLAVATAASIPAGWIVDRFDRRLTMIVADLASAAAATCIGYLAWRGEFQLATVLGAASVLGAGWAVRGLAESAALPNLVAKQDIPRAISRFEARGYATGLAGPPIAAATYSVAAAIPFLSQAVAFFTACFSAFLVRTPLQERVEHHEKLHIREGFRFFWRQRFLRNSALLTAIGDFVVNGCGLVVVVMLTASASSVWVGIGLAIAYGAGMFGAAFAPRVVDRWGRFPVLVGSVAVGTVAVFAMLGQSSLIVVVAYAALLFSRPAWQIVIDTRTAELVDDHQRGRVGSAIDLVTGIPVLFAPALVGLAVVWVGPAVVCAVLGIALSTVIVALSMTGTIHQGVRDASTPQETLVPVGR